MKLDNFALTGWQKCPAWYDLRINHGWTSRGKSAALGFGGAIHEGIATWYKTKDINQAIMAVKNSWPEDHPVDDYRTLAKCITVMMEYVKKYPAEAFQIVGAPDEPMVEVPFTLDTGMFLPVCPACGCDNTVFSSYDRREPGCWHCQSPTLEPIEYGGIFDALVEFNEHVYILEHKTTSQMGAGYFNQFKPNNQVTGYVWGASQLSGRRCNGAIINAVGIYKASATKFERQITSRSPDEIAEWLEYLWHEACLIDYHRRTGVWPFRTSSCTLYGTCEYHRVHTLGNARERERMLEQDYLKDAWDYEKRTGTKEAPNA